LPVGMVWLKRLVKVPKAQALTGWNLELIA
jgi:hypothetical protein